MRRCLVYVDHPMCSIDCADAVCSVLTQTKIYKPILIGPDSFPKLDLTKANLFQGDCIVFPGGMGDSDQFDDRLLSKQKLVQSYIHSGGRYLGICQGSYFAGSHYFNLLRGFDAVQYIKRKYSKHKKTGASVLKIKWKNKSNYRKIYFHDGAAFVPNFVETPSKYKIYGRYINNDVACLIQNINKGKVAVIGPHPEAQKWWFYSQSKLFDHWKAPLNHDILLELFKNLFV